MSLLRSLNVVGLEIETQEKNPLLMKKNKLKKEMKYGDPYKICQKLQW
jgi:hypothetical protein